MNPVDLLLLHARKRDAKQAARHYSLFDLSEQARRFNLEPMTRWKVAGYLLGWMHWRDLETDLMKARTIRFPIA
jgi:hypothetical protein